MALLRVIREDMQRQLERVSVDEGRIVSEIQNRLSSIALDDTKKELQRLSARLDELDAYAARLYEDRLDGAINLDTYMTLSAESEVERGEAQAEHERLSQALETAERQVLGIDRWVSGIRSYLSLDTPDPDTLRALIERIEVGEGEGKGKKRRQAVKIFYRLVGFMD